MAVVYVLPHFDDEYCAAPLIRQDLARGRDLRFLFLADYRDPAVGQRRRRETLSFLAREGVKLEDEIHLGRGKGWWDGELHRHVEAVYPALKAWVSRIGGVERLVAPAWEGGHPDHDICAALTARLARDLGGVSVDQLSLYQGKGLAWLFYRACAPLEENGPVRELRLTRGEWLAWAAGVRAFPSQLKSWSGLWPTMFLTFLRQGAFRYQTLAPGRIDERPHAGALLYERMFGTSYAVVRAAADRIMALE